MNNPYINQNTHCTCTSSSNDVKHTYMYMYRRNWHSKDMKWKYVNGSESFLHKEQACIFKCKVKVYHMKHFYVEIHTHVCSLFRVQSESTIICLHSTLQHTKNIHCTFQGTCTSTCIVKVLIWEYDFTPLSPLKLYRNVYIIFMWEKVSLQCETSLKK